MIEPSHRNHDAIMGGTIWAFAHNRAPVSTPKVLIAP
jgi:hypothetical protein